MRVTWVMKGRELNKWERLDRLSDRNKTRCKHKRKIAKSIGSSRYKVACPRQKICLCKVQLFIFYNFR